MNLKTIFSLIHLVRVNPAILSDVGLTENFLIELKSLLISYFDYVTQDFLADADSTHQSVYDPLKVAERILMDIIIDFRFPEDLFLAAFLLELDHEIYYQPEKYPFKQFSYQEEISRKFGHFYNELLQGLMTVNFYLTLFGSIGLDVMLLIFDNQGEQPFNFELFYERSHLFDHEIEKLLMMKEVSISPAFLENDLYEKLQLFSNKINLFIIDPEFNLMVNYMKKSRTVILTQYILGEISRVETCDLFNGLLYELTEYERTYVKKLPTFSDRCRHSLVYFTEPLGQFAKNYSQIIPSTQPPIKLPTLTQLRLNIRPILSPLTFFSPRIKDKVQTKHAKEEDEIELVTINAQKKN